MSEDLSIYERFRDACKNEVPVSLVTVIADSREIGNAAPQTESTETKNSEGASVIGKRMLLVAPSATNAIGTDTSAIYGDLGDEELTRVVARDALGMLDAGLSEVRHYGPQGEARQDELSVFVECHARKPHMVIFGAVDFTRALADQAKLLGYRVTVCDAREVFATKKRFPSADEIVVDWPNRLLDRIGADLSSRDAVCVLTHDAKFDVPAIVGALATRVGYLGAMGSRKTHKKRVKRLKEEGVTDEELARIRAPIGLDIGGRTPEETAVSIVAEIITHHTKHAAPTLTQAQGSIH